MNDLGFIKYLIKLSNEYDSNIHKYYPTGELRNHYNQKICEKFNLDKIIDLEINFNLRTNDFPINNLLNKIKEIKLINKKFVIIPCRIIIKNISHAVVIVYYKNTNKFYICDSTNQHGNNPDTLNKLIELYKIIFDNNYKIICYSIQDLEKNNNYIKYKDNEYSRGYCLAWSYLLSYLLIKYNWIEIEKLTECMMWNIEYSPKLARKLIRGFIVYMCG